MSPPPQQMPAPIAFPDEEEVLLCISIKLPHKSFKMGHEIHFCFLIFVCKRSLVCKWVEMCKKKSVAAPAVRSVFAAFSSARVFWCGGRIKDDAAVLLLCLL